MTERLIPRFDQKSGFLLTVEHQLLLAALTDEWEGAPAIAVRAGLKRVGAGQMLSTLHRRGFGVDRKPGHTNNLYRRAS